MKPEIIIPESLKVGYELQMPESIRALMGITMFWSPNFDKGNRPVTSEELEKLATNQARGKAERGYWWRKAHALLINLNLPRKKENVIKTYQGLRSQEKAQT